MIKIGVLLHDAARYVAEGFVRLADEVVDPEANHLFDCQTLSLAEFFEPTHFFI